MFRARSFRRCLIFRARIKLGRSGNARRHRRSDELKIFPRAVPATEQPRVAFVRVADFAIDANLKRRESEGESRRIKELRRMYRCNASPTEQIYFHARARMRPVLPPRIIVYNVIRLVRRCRGARLRVAKRFHRSENIYSIVCNSILERSSHIDGYKRW